MMQHYCTPTRLLDWTESLFVALYFAILPYLNDDESETFAPCIYVTNPYKLTRCAIKSAEPTAPLARHNDGLRLIEITAHSDLDYARNFITDHSWKFDSPLPISSPWQNRRLDSQSGFFTVHGNNQAPMDNQVSVSKNIKKIDISIHSLPHVKRLLNDANINHYTLFRDLESLSKLLKAKFS